MKKYNELWFPDGDTETPPAVYNEWSQKGKIICDYVKNKNVVVQAGGNAGLFPINLSSIFNVVHTFEPAPETYECFTENLKERPEINNINLYKAGLGSKTAKAIVNYLYRQNAGANTVEYDQNGDVSIITVDSLNLDDMNLLWLDIEGFEIEALKGSAETIMKYKPVIVLENKGLIAGFGGNIDGSQKVLDWMKVTFNYEKVERLMRDDIFLPC